MCSSWDVLWGQEFCCPWSSAFCSLMTLPLQERNQTRNKRSRKLMIFYEIWGFAWPSSPVPCWLFKLIVFPSFTKHRAKQDVAFRQLTAVNTAHLFCFIVPPFRLLEKSWLNNDCIAREDPMSESSVLWQLEGATFPRKHSYIEDVLHKMPPWGKIVEWLGLEEVLKIWFQPHCHGQGWTR